MKKIVIVLVLISIVFALVSCNRTLIDTTYKFDYAIISLPDGKIVEGRVEGWKDWEDGNQIQIKINGTTYFTDMENVCLIAY